MPPAAGVIVISKSEPMFPASAVVASSVAASDVVQAVPYFIIIAIPRVELKDSSICALLFFTNIVGALIIIHVKKNNFTAQI
jgi:hypothetical protein